MNIDTWPGYDIWKCHDPREDEPDEPTPEEREQFDEYVVDLQNEAVADNGWDLLDADQLGKAVAFLKAHRSEYERRAAEALRRRG